MKFKSYFMPCCLAIAILLSGCSSNKPYVINLMQAPGVFSEVNLDPLDKDLISSDDLPYSIFYATDREPQNEPTVKEPFYKNKRGHVLRVGKAKITLSNNDITWEEARQIAIAKNRSAKYPLRVTKVTESGIVNTSYSLLYKPEMLNSGFSSGEKQFIAELNSKLEESKNQDIYLYIHGFKVNFENPLLVATELWHYLGYDGAFIAYAWPSTPSIWAYAADAESTLYAAHNLRLFLEYLAKNTNARRIHVIGYSAGTRLVVETLHQFSLLYNQMTDEQIDKKLRLGQVILIGSDIDRALFAAYLVGGIWRIPDALDVYLSDKDEALSWANWFYHRQRLGQKLDTDSLSPEAIAFFKRNPSIRLIDVSDAENSGNANGHAYFRDSPWVSSDLLINLRFQLSPGRRGLVHQESPVLWTFPSDYVARMLEVLKELAPELFPVGGAISAPKD